MATLYVDSTAGGANDGTSWTDAYLSLNTAWSAWTSSDVIWLASDHYETWSGNHNWGGQVNITVDNPCIIYSVDSSDDSYTPATTRQLEVTGGWDLTFNDSVCGYGIYCRISRRFDLQGGTDVSIYSYWQDCTFEFFGTNAFARFDPQYPVLVNSCTIDSTMTSNGVRVFGTDHDTVFQNCVFSGRAASTGLFVDNGTASRSGFNAAMCVDSDFTGLTTATTLVETQAVRFLNCNYASGVIPAASTTSQGEHIANYASDLDGAGTAKNYVAEHLMMAGSVIQDTAIYRDDGWTSEDGSTQLSEKMAPSSTLRGPHTPMVGPDIRGYVGATGSTTFTIYGVEDFATGPNLDEVWMEVFYLGTTNSLMYSLAGGRSTFSTTGLTSDTKAWTGASGKTKFKLSQTVTINKTGDYIIRVYCGRYESAKALWYCPLVEIS